MNRQEINQVIDAAKQRRAEYIGSILRSHPLPITVVAVLSLVLLQFTTVPGPDDGDSIEVAQVVAQVL